MLQVAIKSAGMHGLFDHVLSVDAVRKYKTSADAYALAPSLRLPCRAHPVRHLQRLGRRRRPGSASPPSGSTAAATPRALDVAPTVQGSLLTDVVDFVARHRA
jgi:2-haloacid dehalogenase